MNKLKSIIIDDERLVRKNLIELLNNNGKVEVIGEADSCKKGIELLKKLKPDILFLDIELGGGETGFDFLEQTEVKCIVVFVTAYDQYAIRAFEVNALDYLLKPVNPKRLEVTIERILKKNTPQEKKYNYDDCVFVKLNNSSSKFIRLNEIIYIKSEGNYTNIITRSNRNTLVLKTLKKWEAELPEKFFLRAHNSHIINIEYIEKIVKQINGTYNVFLKCISDSLEVSRRYSGKINLLYK